jgi:hypothetical protein
MEDNKKQTEKELEQKLNKFINKDCGSDQECLMKQPEEIVQREHKKIITTDGRQLLSEYTH